MQSKEQGKMKQAMWDELVEDHGPITNVVPELQSAATDFGEIGTLIRDCLNKGEGIEDSKQRTEEFRRINGHLAQMLEVFRVPLEDTVLEKVAVRHRVWSTRIKDGVKAFLSSSSLQKQENRG